MLILIKSRRGLKEMEKQTEAANDFTLYYLEMSLIGLLRYEINNNLKPR